MRDKLDKLIYKRSNLLKEQDYLLLDYKDTKLRLKQAEDDNEVKKIKYTIKVLTKRYDNLREEILDVEDEIARIDEDTLDDIVEPIPDDIDVALDYIDEWELRKKRK